MVNDDRLQDLGQRVKAARTRRVLQTQGGGPGRGRAANGMAVGLRIVIEMVAGLAVGVGGGLFLDSYFETAPFLLIVGFILGSGAAFANVIRTARDLDVRAARERAAREIAEDDKG